MKINSPVTWLLIPAGIALTLTSFRTAPSQDGVEPVIQDFEVGDHQLSDEENHELLEKAMKRMMRGQKALKKMVGDPAANQKALIATLVDMIGAVRQSYDLKPPLPEAALEGDHAQAIYNLSYQSDLLSAQNTLVQMHIATLKGDSKALGALYEDLKSNKKKGHDLYKHD